MGTAQTAFSVNQVRYIIALAALSASFSGFASNIYFPAIPTMAEALSTTVENIDLTVTSYMISQALAPTLWGPFSDTYGRRLALLCTFTIFISACIGLALIRHYYQLVILRCLQSFGSASTIAIGSGMLGDITDRNNRGGYMGVFQTGLLMPLAIGPVLGGIFAETLGWRSIFWFLVIYAGVFLTIIACTLPETLQSIVGDGKTPPSGVLQVPAQHWVSPADTSLQPAKLRRSLRIDLRGPIDILRHPDVALVVFFLSLHYATWQMSITAQSSLFKAEFDLTELQIGLTFLANGLGCMLGTLTTGKLLDHDYRRAKGSGNRAPSLEILRLRTLWVWSPLQCAAVLAFGWSIDRHVHIAAPIVFSFILAWSAMSAQSVISTYLVDLFPRQSATATAALNLGRCLFGAGATAAVQPSINAIGVGWTFTMWACFLVLSLSLIAVQMRYAGHWRSRREGGADACSP